MSSSRKDAKTQRGVRAAPADLWERVAERVARPERPGLGLSVGTAEALARAYPAEAVGPGLRARLERRFEGAVRDAEFEAAVAAGRQRLSLGAYLGFLRQQAGLTAAETAKRVGLAPQQLADLEWDRVRPQEIPTGRLATLVRRLHGSLEQTERLLPTLVQARPTLAATPRGSLYRAPRGATRAQSEAASLAARGEAGIVSENPAYREELEAVRELRERLRKAWKA